MSYIMYPECETAYTPENMKKNDFLKDFQFFMVIKFLKWNWQPQPLSILVACRAKLQTIHFHQV